MKARVATWDGVDGGQFSVGPVMRTTFIPCCYASAILPDYFLPLLSSQVALILSTPFPIAQIQQMVTTIQNSFS